MKILLGACSTCELLGLERVQRRPWMRLFPFLRHYYCGQCNKTVLARKKAVDAKQWATTTIKMIPASESPRPLAPERQP